MMTVEEFWDFVHRPENLDRNFELVRGEVVEVGRRTERGGVSGQFLARTIEELNGATARRLVSIDVALPNDIIGEKNQWIQDQLDAGIALVWLVDPESRTVTVYRPGKQHYVVKENGELTGDDVLPDFKCKVREFFVMPGQ